jgi:hypothetical protein
VLLRACPHRGERGEVARLAEQATDVGAVKNGPNELVHIGTKDIGEMELGPLFPAPFEILPL